MDGSTPYSPPHARRTAASSPQLTVDGFAVAHGPQPSPPGGRHRSSSRSGRSAAGWVHRTLTGALPSARESSPACTGHICGTCCAGRAGKAGRPRSNQLERSSLSVGWAAYFRAKYDQTVKAWLEDRVERLWEWLLRNRRPLSVISHGKTPAPIRRTRWGGLARPRYPRRVYNSLQIENFRGLRRLELSRVAPVTILTGRNNVGKTAVLEALFLHASGPQAALKLLTTLRPYRSGSSLVNIEVSRRSSPWETAFYNRDIKNSIRLSAQLDRERITIELSTPRQSGSSHQRRVPPSPSIRCSFPTRTRRSRMYLPCG